MQRIIDLLKTLKLSYIFAIVVLFILILPYDSSGGHFSEEGDYEWFNNYVFKTSFYLLAYIPLFTLAMFILFLRNQSMRKVALWINLLLCCTYSFFAFMGLSIPAQDYAPHFGTLLMLTVGPLAILLLMRENSNIKAANNK